MLLFMARIAIARRRRRPRGRKWVNSLNTGDNRNKYGAYRAILAESRLSNESHFFYFVRMTPSQFEYIHSKVAPYIQPGKTNFRHSIPTGKNLSFYCMLN